MLKNGDLSPKGDNPNRKHRPTIAGGWHWADNPTVTKSEEATAGLNCYALNRQEWQELLKKAKSHTELSCH